MLTATCVPHSDHPRDLAGWLSTNMDPAETPAKTAQLAETCSTKLNSRGQKGAENDPKSRSGALPSAKRPFPPKCTFYMTVGKCKKHIGMLIFLLQH
jgi:hypothetical protein